MDIMFKSWKIYYILACAVIFILSGCTSPVKSSGVGSSGESLITDKSGAFLVVNSWGKGGTWEHIPDGKYWITFNAAKKVKLFAYIQAKNKNIPKARISFKISGILRSYSQIYMGYAPKDTAVGNEANLTQKKQFIQLYVTMGALPFPDAVISADVTEYLSKMKDNDVYFIMTNNDSSDASVSGLRLDIWDTSADYSGPPAHSLAIGGTSVIIPENTGSFKFATSSQDWWTSGSINYSNSADLNENVKLSLNKPTAEQISSMKSAVGIYKEGKDYNELYQDRYGTGLRPPTEEEWEIMANSDSYITGAVKSGEFAGALDSLDRTAEPYFPPIGNQGKKGSCASFSTGYYIQTYYIAKAYGWNSYLGNSGNILSPEYLFDLVCGGPNDSRGSSFFDNMCVLTQYGICTLSTLPYTDADRYSLDWPSTPAPYIEAPLYRATGTLPGSSYSYASIQLIDDASINTVLSLLESGYLCSIGVYAGSYSNFSSKDVWADDNLIPWTTTNHANTIAGFKRTFNPNNP